MFSEKENINASDNKDYMAVLETACDTVTSYLEEGRMKLPVVAAMVAVNGAFLCGRITKSAQTDLYDVKPLATHAIHGGMQVPIHVLLIDRKGKSANFTIDSRDSIQH